MNEVLRCLIQEGFWGAVLSEVAGCLSKRRFWGALMNETNQNPALRSSVHFAGSRERGRPKLLNWQKEVIARAASGESAMAIAKHLGQNSKPFHGRSNQHAAVNLKWLEAKVRFVKSQSRKLVFGDRRGRWGEAGSIGDLAKSTRSGSAVCAPGATPTFAQVSGWYMSRGLNFNLLLKSKSMTTSRCGLCVCMCVCFVFLSDVSLFSLYFDRFPCASDALSLGSFRM